MRSPSEYARARQSLEAFVPLAPSLSPGLEHERPHERGGPPEPRSLPGLLGHPILAAEHDGRADAVRRREDQRAKGECMSARWTKAMFRRLSAEKHNQGV